MTSWKRPPLIWRTWFAWKIDTAGFRGGGSDPFGQGPGSRACFSCSQACSPVTDHPLTGFHSGVQVFLGMGSNLGQRFGFLEGGLKCLAENGVHLEEISPVVETPALDAPDQPAFLNLVVRGRWMGTPMGLLEIMRRAEGDAGRERPFPNAPRTLDVDLVFFGAMIIRHAVLRVPHPSWKARSFVVHPLRALAPGWVDPETGFRVREVAKRWCQKPQILNETDGEELSPLIESRRA